MSLGEAERARLAAGLADLMQHLADGYLRDRGLDRDSENIIVTAAVSTAIGTIRRRGIDAPAGVALVTCLAEALAGGWKEPANVG